MRLRNTMHPAPFLPPPSRVYLPSRHAIGCGDNSLVSYYPVTLTVDPATILRHSFLWNLPVTGLFPLVELSSIITLKPMEEYRMRTTLPETGFVRLSTIIGDPKADPPIPPIIPVSKSTWWAGVKSGRYPQPVKKLGPKITAWKVSDIRALIEGQPE